MTAYSPKVVFYRDSCSYQIRLSCLHPHCHEVFLVWFGLENFDQSGEFAISKPLYRFSWNCCVRVFLTRSWPASSCFIFCPSFQCTWSGLPHSCAVLLKMTPHVKLVNRELVLCWSESTQKLHESTGSSIRRVSLVLKAPHLSLYASQF